jgi:hypothetical protein
MIVDFWVVHMVPDLLDWQVRIDCLIVRDFVHVRGRLKVRNDFRPMFLETRMWLAILQEYRKRLSIHGGIPARSQDTLGLCALGRRPVMKLELGLVVKGRLGRRRGRRFKEHDEIDIFHLFLFESFRNVVRVSVCMRE